MNSRSLSVLLLAALPVLSLAGDTAPETGSPPAAATAPAPSPSANLAAMKRAVVLHHAKMIYANYTDCVTMAKRMQTAIRQFLASPDAQKLAAARKAWTLARQPYLQSESYRNYAGPIDDADGPESLLNSWPLDENYIDAPPGSKDPGIVGNVRAWPQLTPDLIKSLNQADGEKNVACGWHAVEYLLWGKDTSVTGPGDRQFTDYTVAPFAKRRGKYLQACADLIVEELTDLTKEWAPDDLGNYRAVFEEGVDYSVERIISAIIFLTENELSGERLQVAWDTRDQENEHSCFSDTTHQDCVFDAIGVQNVWRGTYACIDGTKLSGPGLRDLCQAAKPDHMAKLVELIDGNVKKAEAIPQPFDQAILGNDEAPGRKAVMAEITSLEDTGATLRKLARALDIEVPEVPPEGTEG
jgi:putative iron-regulated protein